MPAPNSRCIIKCTMVHPLKCIYTQLKNKALTLLTGNLIVYIISICFLNQNLMNNISPFYKTFLQETLFQMTFDGNGWLISNQDIIHLLLSTLAHFQFFQFVVILSLKNFSMIKLKDKLDSYCNKIPPKEKL